MPSKGFKLKLQQLTDLGEFEGWASVYDEEDLGGDVVDPGAFTKTLQTSGPQRPLLWQHRDPVGVVTLSDTGSALAAKGQLSMGVEKARDAFELMRAGAVRGLSIGYETVKDRIVGEVRHLQELKLWEVSLVTFPMNEMATVTSVKAQQVAQQQAARHAEIRRALKSFRTDVIRALNE